MAFELGGKYEADNGRIYGIRLDTTRYAVAGTPPAGSIDQPQRVEVSASNRQGGLRPRAVRLARTLGTAPDTFQKYASLPVLTPAEYGTAPFALGETITINSVAWTVVGLQPENAN